MPDAESDESVATATDSDSEQEQGMNRLLECPKCGFRTLTINNSNSSKYCGMPKNYKGYKCKHCHLKFTRKFNLKRHEKLYCPERSKTIVSSSEPICAVCSKIFQSPDALEQHHFLPGKCGRKSRRYHCVDCKKNYKSEMTLEHHKRGCRARKQRVAAAKSNDAMQSTRKTRSTANSSGKRNGPLIDSEKEDATPAPLLRKAVVRLERMTSSSSEQRSSSGISAANFTRKRRSIESHTSSHCSDDSYLIGSRNSRSSHLYNNANEEKHSSEESEQEAPSQSRSGNGTKSTKTDRLREIERQQELIELEEEETRLQLKLLQCARKKKKLTEEKKRLKSK